MSNARTSVSSAIAVLGLAGGFLVARRTGRRELGGALFAAAGAWCARDWYRASGPTAAAGLTAVYIAAMGGSHPLAKRIGAWPSVAAVTAGTVAAAEVVTRVAARLSVGGGDRDRGGGARPDRADLRGHAPRLRDKSVESRRIAWPGCGSCATAREAAREGTLRLRITALFSQSVAQATASPLKHAGLGCARSVRRPAGRRHGKY